MRHFMYVKCVPFKMHLACKYCRTVRVFTLKVFLILRSCKICVYMLVKDVFL